ncbi:NAD(P)/FAD-dependent oxidoreductase [Cupriavidus sp. AU9028]|uniref:NAD(P)/FAD-dependent oxidoreductase n=1 Tax=Cupriavidus sp. AU9028 TaxID=2871157 RepID=UPI001C97681B|nr:NAD(P)/FAD-dependent oxidoreductase [Cupriavidus sp. AU9028]MBY4897454.1 NAD(P)/FAD-dependent oxidoreductase [Cupriavidus sp. AU9028]
MTITRRDFLNGAALALGSGLCPSALLHAQTAAAAAYPPALTGLRGNHAGTFTLAHSLAREGTQYPPVLAREAFDAVIVGAGLSGLVAAWHYRQRFGPARRILLLDNHDDFGGHAKRNEFTVRGQQLVSYGGSAGLPASALSSPAVSLLFEALGLDRGQLLREAAPADAGASAIGRAVFFNREHFGRDVLVPGDPIGATMGAAMGATMTASGQSDRQGAGAGDVTRFLQQAPLPPDDRAAIARLAAGTTDYLGDLTAPQRHDYLARTSYAAFLRDRAGVGLAGRRFLRGRTVDTYALDIEGVSVLDAAAIGLPAGLGVAPTGTATLGQSPQARLWLPDGNAGLARLLVRALIPAAAPAGPAARIAEARFDYARLDRDDAPVRLRLNSTVLAVEPEATLTRVTYGWRGNLHRIEARHVVLAGYNMMIPFLLPPLPAARKDALRDAVKAPLVYSKVALNDWRAFAALRAGRIHAPTMSYTDVWLETPAQARPEQPVVLHMVQVPVVPDSGMPARDRFRAGRAWLLGTPYEAMEREILAQLDRMLAAGGFEARRDVSAITVNRWAHGYSYRPTPLHDGPGAGIDAEAAVRTPFPHVTIANSDSAGIPSLTAALEQGLRAVQALQD